MTISAPQSDYQRAIARANSQGIEILGRGRYSKSQEPFFLISSATDPSRPHVVRHSGHIFACDCTAGQYGRMCVHVARVRELLEREATEIQSRIEQTRASVAADRETAMLATRADNKPFSIFAAS